MFALKFSENFKYSNEAVNFKNDNFCLFLEAIELRAKMGNIINVLKTCKDSGKAKVHIKIHKNSQNHSCRFNLHFKIRFEF